jgi:ABC-2 type transport system ATP-binding protein
MSDIVIEVKNLTKKYENKGFSSIALDGISFDIKRGEFVSLIGPDGAGKTTLIKALCGLLEFDEGDVKILGFNLPLQKEHIKERIGYLSQRFSLYGNLTVEENLHYFAAVFGVKDYAEKMEKLMEIVNLKEYRNRLARNLSGGMKQKLSVICGLIHSPEIFFLDEPTTGVDPVSRREIFKLIEQMIANGLTVVMSTSYMDEAERAHRVIMLNKGKILQQGSYEELIAECKWRNLVIETNEVEYIKGIIAALQGVKFINAFSRLIYVLVDDSFSVDEVNEMVRGHIDNIYFSEIGMEGLFIANTMMLGF